MKFNETLGTGTVKIEKAPDVSVKYRLGLQFAYDLAGKLKKNIKLNA